MLHRQHHNVAGISKDIHSIVVITSGDVLAVNFNYGVADKQLAGSIGSVVLVDARYENRQFVLRAALDAQPQSALLLPRYLHHSLLRLEWRLTKLITEHRRRRRDGRVNLLWPLERNDLHGEVQACQLRLAFAVAYHHHSGTDLQKGILQ